MTISKGERDELRRVVRTDFKVLAEEMTIREAEMQADIEQRIATRFLPSDEAIAAAEREAAAVVSDANVAIAAVMAELAKNADGYTIDWQRLAAPRILAMPVKRQEMRRAALAELRARVVGAKAKVHRQEADLLKSLASGALESEEARSFLAAIPSVAELVPAARLAELEAQFDDRSSDE